MKVTDLTTFQERQAIRILVDEMEARRMAKAASPVVTKDTEGNALITVKQAKRLLNKSESWVRQQIRQGVLKSYKQGDSKVTKLQLNDVKSLADKTLQAPSGHVVCNKCNKPKPARWVDNETGVCSWCLDKATRPAKNAGGRPKSNYVLLGAVAKKFGVTYNEVYRRVMDGEFPSKTIKGKKMMAMPLSFEHKCNDRCTLHKQSTPMAIAQQRTNPVPDQIQVMIKEKNLKPVFKRLLRAHTELLGILSEFVE